MKTRSVPQRGSAWVGIWELRIVHRCATALWYWLHDARL